MDFQFKVQISAPSSARGRQRRASSGTGDAKPGKKNIENREKEMIQTKGISSSVYFHSMPSIPSSKSQPTKIKRQVGVQLILVLSCLA